MYPPQTYSISGQTEINVFDSVFVIICFSHYLLMISNSLASVLVTVENYKSLALLPTIEPSILKLSSATNQESNK